MAKQANNNASKQTISLTVPRLNFSKNIALGALIAELIGTFFLVFGIITTQGNAIVAALTVLVIILVFGAISGAHVNPAVTIAQLALRKISIGRATGYLLAQVLGGMLALVAANGFLGQLGTLSARPVDGWQPFFGELIGSLVLGLGVGAVVITQRKGLEAAYTIAGALLIGLVIATVGSQAILNPAAALGLQTLDFTNVWAVLGYLVAPLLGGAGGALLYKLLQSDVMQAAKK